ncbi:MAG: HPr family phosphocarrier protein [Neomegalonema sp.]|nr:HPr family phosphocarrier protein [Neomegalonema sp.]
MNETAPPQGPLHARLEIVNAKGLHARASAKLSTLAQQFDAKVEISRDSLSVSGGSLMGLLLLAAAKGCFIDLRVEGPDAEKALSAISDLVASGFGENS